jgi:hypothetical protein
MDKCIFLVKSGGERRQFADRMLDEVVPRLLPLKPERLKLSLTMEPNPRLTILPLRPENLAMISVGGTLAVAEWIGLLQNSGTSLAGYRVEESAPVAYRKDWPDGQVSPGLVLLTLLKQNARLTHTAFMQEWHGVHTPKAMRIHPMWSYIRNVISAPVVPGSPVFEGIVEEHYRYDREVLNPVRMFGGPLKFIPNMVEVGRHVNYFLDLKRCENYLLREYHLKG